MELLLQCAMLHKIDSYMKLLKIPSRVTVLSQYSSTTADDLKIYSTNRAPSSQLDRVLREGRIGNK